MYNSIGTSMAVIIGGLSLYVAAYLIIGSVVTFGVGLWWDFPFTFVNVAKVSFSIYVIAVLKSLLFNVLSKK